MMELAEVGSLVILRMQYVGTVQSLLSPFIAVINHIPFNRPMYRGADKSLARPGRKQARNYIRDARDFNNIETRAVINFFSLQGMAPKEIHAILTETLACFPSWSG